MIKWSLLLLFVYSCNTTSSIIPQKKMQAIIWDLMKADALAQQLILKDSLKKLPQESKKITDRVFVIHDITEDQFKKSYQYYSEHPDILKIIMDSINAQESRKTFTIPALSKPSVMDSNKN